MREQQHVFRLVLDRSYWWIMWAQPSRLYKSIIQGTLNPSLSSVSAVIDYQHSQYDHSQHFPLVCLFKGLVDSLGFGGISMYRAEYFSHLICKPTQCTSILQPSNQETASICLGKHNIKDLDARQDQNAILCIFHIFCLSLWNGTLIAYPHLQCHVFLMQGLKDEVSISSHNWKPPRNQLTHSFVVRLIAAQ